MSSTPVKPQRTAIVTGGARGIGSGIARRLADDGFKVALLDLDGVATADLAVKLGSDATAAIGLQVDVSDDSAVRAGVETVRRELGAPTVLVNNAGNMLNNPLFRMSVDEWDQVVAVHLRGAFLMTRAVHGFMTEAGWGRIVNISSTSALGNRGQANYATAKAGLQGFTRSLAIELGPFGITANAVAPGFVESQMTYATAARVGMDFEVFKQVSANLISVRRTGLPEDIAHAVSFFVDDRSGFVSGQVLYVSGGPPR